jgi:hypothetical protein
MPQRREVGRDGSGQQRTDARVFDAELAGLADVISREEASGVRIAFGRL